MFHKAVKLNLMDGTRLELTFQDGTIKAYDMAALFPKYPQLEALKNRSLFLSGRLMGAYGIVWNDELDVEAETIYEDGETVGHESISGSIIAADALSAARAQAGISQAELAARTGIDQSDISKIERGAANPSVTTLSRLAGAMGMELKLSFCPSNE